MLEDAFGMAWLKYKPCRICTIHFWGDVHLEEKALVTRAPKAGCSVGTRKPCALQKRGQPNCFLPQATPNYPHC